MKAAYLEAGKIVATCHQEAAVVAAVAVLAVAAGSLAHPSSGDQMAEQVTVQAAACPEGVVAEVTTDAVEMAASVQKGIPIKTEKETK